VATKNRYLSLCSHRLHGLLGQNCSSFTSFQMAVTSRYISFTRVAETLYTLNRSAISLCSVKESVPEKRPKAEHNPRELVEHHFATCLSFPATVEALTHALSPIDYANVGERHNKVCVARPCIGIEPSRRGHANQGGQVPLKRDRHRTLFVVFLEYHSQRSPQEEPS
jgi:hypothetical protein